MAKIEGIKNKTPPQQPIIGVVGVISGLVSGIKHH